MQAAQARVVGHSVRVGSQRLDVCRGAVELIDVQELNQVADDEVDQGDRSGADTTTPTYNMNNVSKGGPYAAAVL